MRRLITGAWSVQSNGIELLQPVFRRVSIGLAIAGTLCLSVAFGEGQHSRLLSLEADKLVAIEKVLKKDQLTQLCTNRQNAPELANVAVNSNQSKKSE